jgi:hypothetical protein
MKVLKRVDNSAWSYKFTCSSCDSELEAENKDILYNYVSGDMRDPGYEQYYVKCEICSQSHTIPDSKLNKSLKHSVKERSQKRSSSSYFDR